MTLKQKIQMGLISMAMLGVLYGALVGSGPQYKTSGVVQNEETAFRVKSEAPSLEFENKIKTPSDVLTELSVQLMSDHYRTVVSTEKSSLRSLADDFKLTSFDQFRILDKSLCGLRSLSYFAKTMDKKQDKERLRLFWPCSGRCEAVVSEVLAGVPKDRLGRHVVIEMPILLCQNLFNPQPDSPNGAKK